jgi:hypothetical protein
MLASIEYCNKQYWAVSQYTESTQLSRNEPLMTWTQVRPGVYQVCCKDEREDFPYSSSCTGPILRKNPPLFKSQMVDYSKRKREKKIYIYSTVPNHFFVSSLLANVQEKNVWAARIIHIG